MNNNDIFKKLRVALQLRDDQIAEIMELVDFRISKGEIGNFFRNADHEKYVECGDQVLRNFLNGLVIHLRGTKEAPKVPAEVIKANAAAIEKTAKAYTSNENAAPKSAAPKPVAKKPAGKNFKPKKVAAKINPVENVKFNNGKPKKK